MSETPTPAFRVTGLPNVMQAVESAVWAILPEKLDAILSALDVRTMQGAASMEALQARLEALGARRAAPEARTNGAVAVIPLFGTIVPRANMMTEFSGGTAVSQWIKQVEAAVNDPKISAIVIEVDSPGGAVSGVQEAADALHDLRGSKPIVAVANTLMASAAYWLASQADSVVASPSADVGSIGVYTVHRDFSRAFANEGVSHTVIKAGRFKAEGLPYEPLSPEARAELQARVDESHDQFINAIARGRGVSAADVRSGYGEGRVLSAQKALSAGIVDRVATLDTVVNELAAGDTSGIKRRKRADASTLPAAIAASVEEMVAVDARVAAAIEAFVAPTLASDTSAGSTDAALPSRTEPAPQAEETTVETSTQAPTGAGNGAAAALAGPSREQQLADLVELRPEASHRLSHWIRSGTSYDDARKEVAAGIQAPAPATAASAGATRVGNDRASERPWANFGEFGVAVAAAYRPGSREVDPRLFGAATGVNQQVPSEGGLLVPQQFRTDIWQGLFDDPTNLIDQMDRYTVEGDSLVMPKNKETTRADGSVYGGVLAYWRNEADQVLGSKPKWGEMKLEPQELFAMVYITEKMLRNSPIALDQYLKRAATAAIGLKSNSAIINGDGVGKPKGVLASGSKITVAKETGQAAATIKSKNISKMFKRLPPAARSRALWLHTVEIEDQLDELMLEVRNVAGTENVGGLATSLYNNGSRTLKGRPMIPCSSAQPLGTEGDLVLIDPLGYAVGLRAAGITEAASMHVRFEYAEMAFRFLFELDGQSWIDEAITPENGGATQSNIITLATRA